MLRGAVQLLVTVDRELPIARLLQTKKLWYLREGVVHRSVLRMSPQRKDVADSRKTKAPIETWSVITVGAVVPLSERWDLLE